MRKFDRYSRLLVRGSLIAAGAVAVAALPNLALAQDADDERATAGSNDDGEIVVTARRREESLQETPIAVSAFSAETLSDRGIETTSDLETIVPSLQF